MSKNISKHISLETSLVDIAFIHSSEKRSSFSETNLENLANLMLQLNGIINPLILKRIGIEKLEVIDGHFEYYAAVKAQEIDSKFEMIRAFIVTDEQVKLVEQQLNLLTTKTTLSNQNSELNLSNSDVRLNYLDARLNEINGNLQPLKEIKEMVLNLQQQLQQNQVEPQPEIKEIKEAGEGKLELLNAFNTLPIHQLVLALKRAEITQKEAEKIAESVKKEREKQSFTSLNDVVNRVKKTHGKRQIKAISLEKMLDIVDTWSKISFNF